MGWDGGCAKGITLADVDSVLRRALEFFKWQVHWFDRQQGTSASCPFSSACSHRKKSSCVNTRGWIFHFQTADGLDQRRSLRDECWGEHRNKSWTIVKPQNIYMIWHVWSVASTSCQHKPRKRGVCDSSWCDAFKVLPFNILLLTVGQMTTSNV